IVVAIEGVHESAFWTNRTCHAARTATKEVPLVRLERNLKAHPFHFQKGLCVALRIVDRMMRVGSFSQVFEVLEGVLHQPLVEGAEIRAGVAERIAIREVPEIPVDELPIEPVVITDEEWTPLASLVHPHGEILHHLLGIVERHRLFARVTTHGQGLRNPSLRNGLKPPIEGLVEPLVHQHGTEADHAEISGYGPVGLYVDHKVAHHTCSRAEWNNRQIAGACDRNAAIPAAAV